MIYFEGGFGDLLGFFRRILVKSNNREYSFVLRYFIDRVYILRFY